MVRTYSEHRMRCGFALDNMVRSDLIAERQGVLTSISRESKRRMSVDTLGKYRMCMN